MKVTIATPSYDGNFCAEYVVSLTQTVGILAQSGIPTVMALACGNPFVDRARNELVEQFLASDSTDLLFVDADVGWDAKAVTRVLTHPELVVSGLVPKRNREKDNEFHQNALTGVLSGMGLFQALEAPTAFMRLKREAFIKFKKRHPDALYFHSGTAPKDWGEDIYFCRRWIETGEYLWIDSDIGFTHTGRKIWKGNFYEHAVHTGLLINQSAA